MKRILARCCAIVAAIGVLAAPGTSNGVTGSCQRTVSIDLQASASEGTSTLSFSVRSAGCAAAGAVAYTVSSGSAELDADFRLTPGHLTWAAGDNSVRRITAIVLQDFEREDPLEDFSVRLLAPSADVRIGLSTGEGRVADDDIPNLPALLVTDGICDVEGGAPMCDTDLDLTWYPDPVTVYWETEDGTAIAQRDYIPVIEQVRTIPAGVTKIKLRVQVLPQPAGTPSRWFFVRIIKASKGTVVDSRAIVILPGS